MEYLNLNSFETKRSVTIDSLKTHFLPIQEGEGDPSPDNVRPITGWNSIKVRKCGKNLAKVFGFDTSTIRSVSQTRRKTNIWGTTISETNYADELVITQDGYNNSSNVRHYSNGYFVIGLDALSFDKRYNVSFKITNIVSNPLNASLSDIRISNPYENYYSDPVVTEDGKVSFNNYLYRKNTNEPGRCGIEVYVCGMSFTISEFMITAVEDEDFTYEPYREEEVEVELPETMYSGYVDIAKGEIVQKYKLITITGSESSASFSWNAYTFPSSGLVSSNDVWAVKSCSHTSNLLSGSGMYNSRDSGFDSAICVSRTPVIRYRDRNNFNDFETAKTYLQGQYANGTPVQIVAQLETPIHYPLPPETLKTLRGFNTVFSTGNDSIEVGYSELSPMSLLELRRNIIASEPHLVTVETGNTEDSDAIASFKTNAALLIKSMITNFEPVQEGEGDPSPENIRPITGLKELKIRRCGRNFLDHNLTNPVNPVGFPNASIVVNEDRSLAVSSAAASSTQLLLRNFHGQTRSNANQNDMIKHIPNGVFKYRLGNSTSQFGLQFNYATNESRSDLTDETIPPGLVSIGISRGGTFVESEVTEEMKYNYFRLASYAGNAYSNVTIYPEIYLTSQSDGAYEPYIGDDYQIPLTLPNLITPEPKSITSYNVDFTVNEDGTVDYEGTPTSYAGVVVGFYYPKGGETITATICGDNANICFNAVQIFYDNKWNNPYPALEGKKTYTLDLSEFPDTRIVRIALKRMSNDVYMKGKCWVRVVEGTVDTGDEVFGGYVDLDSNEFVKTWECVGLDSLNWGIWCANTETYPDATPIFRYTGLELDISTEAKDRNNGITWYVSGLQSIWIRSGTNITSYSVKNYPEYGKDLSFTITQSGSRGWLAIRADDYDNVADLKRFLQGKKVAYPKEVPVHFPLSPTVIRTLKGMNNIYTNANGKSIIKYWTH